jgi:hypothetical protein
MTVLGACVQPIAPTPTPIPPTPTVFFTPTPPPIEQPRFPPNVVAQWLQANTPNTPVVNNLVITMQYQINLDDILGFTFQDGAGQNCAGFAQTTIATLTVWLSDYRCVPVGAQLAAGQVPFALTSGDFFTAIYGWVDRSLFPGASAVAIEYPDGRSNNQLLTEGTFVILQEGISLSPTLFVIDTNGNLVGDRIIVQ